LVFVLSALVALVGCGGDSDSPSGFEELYNQGLTRYVGMFEPANERDPVEDVKTYEFAVPGDLAAEPRGPLCLRGTEYTVDTRGGGLR
jgi:hypothetical protein